MKLYMNNRIDGAYHVENLHVAECFMTSPWLDNSRRGWPLSRSLSAFIGSPESEGGLSSTFDVGEDSDFELVLTIVIDLFAKLPREGR